MKLPLILDNYSFSLTHLVNKAFAATIPASRSRISPKLSVWAIAISLTYCGKSDAKGANAIAKLIS